MRNVAQNDLEIRALAESIGFEYHKPPGYPCPMCHTTLQIAHANVCSFDVSIARFQVLGKGDTSESQLKLRVCEDSSTIKGA